MTDADETAAMAEVDRLDAQHESIAESARALAAHDEAYERGACPTHIGPRSASLEANEQWFWLVTWQREFERQLPRDNAKWPDAVRRVGDVPDAHRRDALAYHQGYYDATLRNHAGHARWLRVTLTPPASDHLPPTPRVHADASHPALAVTGGSRKERAWALAYRAGYRRATRALDTLVGEVHECVSATEHEAAPTTTDASGSHVTPQVRLALADALFGDLVKLQVGHCIERMLAAWPATWLPQPRSSDRHHSAPPRSSLPPVGENT